MIWWQLQRIVKSEMVDEVIVATSTSSADDVLAEYLRSLDINFSRGPLDDVLSRFQDALISYPNDTIIVRLTADCPLIMPEQIDKLVRIFLASDYDYISNSINPTFPDGLDIEVFSKSAFNRLLTLNTNETEREHVTLKFKDLREKFKIFNHISETDLSELRWTVDYPEDFDFVQSVYAYFQGRELEFGYEDLLEALSLNPQLRNSLPGSLRNVSLMKDSNET